MYVCRSVIIFLRTAKGPDNAAGPCKRVGMEIIAVVTSNMRLDETSTSYPWHSAGTWRALACVLDLWRTKRSKSKYPIVEHI
jgi:hypothetical protein